MREVALVMESMLQAVEFKKTYETGDGKLIDANGDKITMSVKRRAKPFVPPKLPAGVKLVDQERNRSQEIEAQRSKKEMNYLRRGIMLKDAIRNRDYDPNIDAYGLNMVEKEEL